MNTEYIDELIIYEYGINDINSLKEWKDTWFKWLKYCNK